MPCRWPKRQTSPCRSKTSQIHPNTRYPSWSRWRDHLRVSITSESSERNQSTKCKLQIAKSLNYKAQDLMVMTKCESTGPEPFLDLVLVYINIWVWEKERNEKQSLKWNRWNRETGEMGKRRFDWTDLPLWAAAIHPKSTWNRNKPPSRSLGIILTCNLA